MPSSTNLGLPYIDANQNQKHVTHNTALQILDALVQIQVQSAALTTPPASPSDGQCWIPASGATGAWTGKDLNLACWQSGAWVFFAPKPGYEAFNVATGQLVIWTGTTWAPLVLPTTSNVVPLLPGGFVNKFRNGTLDVWQRGTSMTVATAGAYTADGWIVVPAGASCTVQQAGGRLLTKNSLQVVGASGVTDMIVKQRIESLMAAALSGQTVTVQAQVYNNTGATITPTLTVKRPTVQDNYGTTATDLSAANLQSCANGAWTQVAYTFTANAASFNGLEIGFDFGSNFGASTKSIQITELDIRVTPGAATGLSGAPPPPELRPVGAEMPQCQRYFEKSYRMSLPPGSTWTLHQGDSVEAGGTAGAAIATVKFNAQKRSIPTLTTYDRTGAPGKGSYVVSSAWTDGDTPTAIASDTAICYFSSTSTILVGFAWQASAEL